MLDATLERRLGAFHLEASFRVPPASTLVIVGESGSGKTTVLRLLAGLLKPDRGRITLEDDVWFDDAWHIDRPAWRRLVGWVPQDYALVPHLTVAENVFAGRHPRGRVGSVDWSQMRSKISLPSSS